MSTFSCLHYFSRMAQPIYCPIIWSWYPSKAWPAVLDEIQLLSIPTRISLPCEISIFSFNNVISMSVSIIFITVARPLNWLSARWVPPFCKYIAAFQAFSIEFMVYWMLLLHSWPVASPFRGLSGELLNQDRSLMASHSITWHEHSGITIWRVSGEMNGNWDSACVS